MEAQRTIIKFLAVFTFILSTWLLVCTLQHGIDTTASVTYSFLASRWMFIHIGAFPFVLCGIAYKQAWTSPSWLAAMTVAFYWTHQFEEHGYDIFGRRYHFLYHLAHLLGCDTLSVATSEAGYLTANGCHDAGLAFVAWTNVYMCTSFLHVLILPKARRYIAVANILGIVFMNALIFHIIAGLKAGAYNPGMLQSALINLPFSGYALYRMHRAFLLSTPQLAFAIIGMGLGLQMGACVLPAVFAMAGKLSGTMLHMQALITLFIILPGFSMVGAPTPAAEAGVDEFDIMHEYDFKCHQKK